MSFKSWNWQRILRVLIGLAFAIMAYTENQIIFTIVAVFLIYQAVFNIKCIGSLVPSQKCNQK